MYTEIILPSCSLKCIQFCKEDFNNKANCILNGIASVAAKLQLEVKITYQSFSGFKHDCILMICHIKFFPIIFKINLEGIMLLNMLILWKHFKIYTALNK